MSRKIEVGDCGLNKYWSYPKKFFVHKLSTFFMNEKSYLYKEGVESLSKLSMGQKPLLQSRQTQRPKLCPKNDPYHQQFRKTYEVGEKLCFIPNRTELTFIGYCEDGRYCLVNEKTNQIVWCQPKSIHPI